MHKTTLAFQRSNPRGTSAAAYVAQAVLVLRRRCQQDNPVQLAERLASFAACLQCLIEPLEALERSHDLAALRDEAIPPTHR